MKMKNEINWNPVKNGLTYCSSACGYGCTLKAYEEANKKALDLAKICEEEIGGKWNIRVHENLGWHWCVIQEKSNITISFGGYLSEGDKYDVGIGRGTPSQVYVHPNNFNSPKEAYDAQVKKISSEYNRWSSILNNCN